MKMRVEKIKILQRLKFLRGFCLQPRNRHCRTSNSSRISRSDNQTIFENSMGKFHKIP